MAESKREEALSLEYPGAPPFWDLAAFRRRLDRDAPPVLPVFLTQTLHASGSIVGLARGRTLSILRCNRIRTFGWV